jgi:hypothetical protein
MDVLGRQRHGRVADRCRDLDPVALVRIGSSAMARMMRAAISSSLAADVDGTKTRTLRPPTHDDVRLAQRLAQPAGNGDEYRIAGRVPEAVVRLLEEIDVDQQQRMHGESGSRLHAALRRNRRVAHQLLEVPPVVERGQRIAAAARRQLAVLLREEPVIDAQPLVVDAEHEKRDRDDRREQPPDALAQLLVLELRRVERVLTVEELNLAAVSCPTRISPAARAPRAGARPPPCRR